MVIAVTGLWLSIRGKTAKYLNQLQFRWVKYAWSNSNRGRLVQEGSLTDLFGHSSTCIDVTYASIYHWNYAFHIGESDRFHGGLNVLSAYCKREIFSVLFPWEERWQLRGAKIISPANVLTPRFLLVEWFREQVLECRSVHLRTDVDGCRNRVADIFYDNEGVEGCGAVGVNNHPWPGAMSVWWLFKGNGNGYPRPLRELRDLYGALRLRPYLVSIVGINDEGNQG